MSNNTRQCGDNSTRNGFSRRELLTKAAGTGALLLGTGQASAQTKGKEISEKKRKELLSQYQNTEAIKSKFRSQTTELREYLYNEDLLESKLANPILKRAESHTHVNVIEVDGEITTILQTELKKESGELTIVVYPELDRSLARFTSNDGEKMHIEPQRDSVKVKMSSSPNGPEPQFYCDTWCVTGGCDCSEVPDCDSNNHDEYTKTVYERCCGDGTCSWVAVECCGSLQ